MLSDLASVEKRVKSAKKLKGAGGWASESEATIAKELLSASYGLLQDGRPASDLIPGLSETEESVLKR